MTNVVSRDGYNIPKLTYDGSITASNVTIGDAEDFAVLKEQVSRSGIFVIRRTDPAQAEGFFFGSIDTPTSILGYRIYTATTGMSVVFVTISLPTARPNDMVYTGVQKIFAST